MKERPGSLSAATSSLEGVAQWQPPPYSKSQTLWHRCIASDIGCGCCWWSDTAVKATTAAECLIVENGTTQR